MATGDLTTLDQVKEYLRLPESDHDVLLARLITAASEWFRSQTDRKILASACTETWSGDGGTVRYLPEYPVTAIASLTVDGSAIAARTTGNGYVLDQDTGRVSLVGYTFTKGSLNCTATYTGGFAVAPPDVVQAVLEMVALRFKDRDHIGQSSAVLNGESHVFLGGGNLPHIQSVVDSYRRLDQ